MLHNVAARCEGSEAQAGAPPAHRVSAKQEGRGVERAWPSSGGPFTSTPQGRTAAQRAGLRYERKVHEYLSSQYGEAYVASQWFRYCKRGGSPRWCQPDGILHLGNMAVIFEIKSRFTADAWWQLRGLYAPVVSLAFRPKLLGLCLIVRRYDPMTQFPEQCCVIDDLDAWLVARRYAAMGVFSWQT